MRSACRALATLGQLIKKARKEVGLSQQALAERVGVSQAMVSHWENGRADPTRGYREKLSAVLGVDLEQTKEGESLAVWLKMSRTKKGLSRADLAKAAGISPLTIYFIETGRTESPQDSTLQRLQKVFGEVPGRIAKEVAEEEKIGDFVYRGPFPRTEWGENIGEGTISCIYVFYDKLMRPVRIGSTDSLRRRMKEYEDDYWWFRTPTAESFAYVTVDDSEFMRKAEKVMIKLVGANAIFNSQEKVD